MYLVDADFRVREVNPIARLAFGDIPGGLIGRDFDEVIHVAWAKPYADEIVRIFRRTLETGEPYTMPEHAEVRLDRGITEYYEWRVDRIPLADGRAAWCATSATSRRRCSPGTPSRRAARRCGRPTAARTSSWPRWPTSCATRWPRIRNGLQLMQLAQARRRGASSEAARR